jgi:hypothetical protein
LKFWVNYPHFSYQDLGLVGSLWFNDHWKSSSFEIHKECGKYIKGNHEKWKGFNHEFSPRLLYIGNTNTLSFIKLLSFHFHCFYSPFIINSSQILKNLHKKHILYENQMWKIYICFNLSYLLNIEIRDTLRNDIINISIGNDVETMNAINECNQWNERQNIFLLGYKKGMRNFESWRTWKSEELRNVEGNLWNISFNHE